MLNNFKSYEGEHTIDLNPDLTCVVGPNGSGKSNLMDALAFGFGDRAAHLRSSTFKDLIYTGKDGNEDPAEVGRSMFVNLTVQTTVDVDEDGTAHTEDDIFSRLCTPQGGLSYKLNGKTISKKAFDSAWDDKGVINSVMNFMVFQVRARVVFRSSSSALRLAAEGRPALLHQLNSFSCPKPRSCPESFQTACCSSPNLAG